MRETGNAASLSAVLTHRVRLIAEHCHRNRRQPLVTGNPETAAFAYWLDERMLGQEARIADHALATAPRWATQSLGPVPGYETGRADWRERADKLGRWRQLSGRENEGDALGARPATTFPEMRAEWQRAADVTPRIEGKDLRHLTDGQLLTRRAAFPRETAWAPPDVGHELGAACRAADSYRLQVARHRQLAAAISDPALARPHEQTALECSRAARRSREVAADPRRSAGNPPAAHRADR